MTEQATAEIWLTEEQVCETIGASIYQLRKWRERELGPAYRKMGGAKNSAVRYPQHRLQEWMKAQPIYLPK